jgi:hypothetical protein
MPGKATLSPKVCECAGTDLAYNERNRFGKMTFGMFLFAHPDKNGSDCKPPAHTG